MLSIKNGFVVESNGTLTSTSANGAAVGSLTNEDDDVERLHKRALQRLGDLKAHVVNHNLSSVKSSAKHSHSLQEQDDLKLNLGDAPSSTSSHKNLDFQASAMASEL